MPSRWRYGIVTLYTKSGHTLTFDGAVRTTHDANGYVSDYEVKGDSDFLLTPSLASLDAIAVAQRAPTDG